MRVRYRHHSFESFKEGELAQVIEEALLRTSSRTTTTDALEDMQTRLEQIAEALSSLACLFVRKGILSLEDVGGHVAIIDLEEINPGKER